MTVKLSPKIIFILLSKNIEEIEVTPYKAGVNNDASMNWAWAWQCPDNAEGKEGKVENIQDCLVGYDRMVGCVGVVKSWRFKLDRWSILGGGCWCGAFRGSWKEGGAMSHDKNNVWMPIFKLVPLEKTINVICERGRDHGQVPLSLYTQGKRQGTCVSV